MDITQKSYLAKLLATEDVSIEHRNVPTAYFDLKSRKIVLPNWKDMPDFLYDLLIGHEVGHALVTPAEGWHSAASSKGANFKSFLNVVEDVRNERLVKIRYPGLVKSFYKGYQMLYKKDFFGLSKLQKTPQELPLIDRINLHAKVGAFLTLQFTAEEQVILDKCFAAETWDEVVAIAEELYEFSKTEDAMQDLLEENMGMPQFGEDEDDFDMDENGEWSENPYGEEESEEGEGESKSGEETEESEESEEGGAESGEGEETEEDTEKTTSSKKESEDTEKSAESGSPEDGTIEEGSTESEGHNPHDFDDAEPKSFTDEAFRDAEQNLVEDGKTNGVVTATMPKFKTKYFIFPTTDVWPTKDFEYVCGGRYDDIPAGSAKDVEKTLLDEFMQRNKGSINQLVMQFEMKKKATLLRKAQVNKTGKLNEDKLWAYKLTEDLFLSSTTVPDGQNHGMMMFVDFSGSMGRHMAGTIEQTLIQVAFCKKVGIPFDVYGFSNCANSLQSEKFGNGSRGSAFQSANDGELFIESGGFGLLQLISSELPQSEYNRCFKKLLGYKTSFEWRDMKPRMERHNVPYHLYLGSTPLSSCMIVGAKIAKQFKERNRIEVMNTIVLSDGGNTSDIEVIAEGQYEENGYFRYKNAISEEFAGRYGENKCEIGKFQLKGNGLSVTTNIKGMYGTNYGRVSYESATAVTFDYYKKFVGSRIVHFFLVDNNIREARQAWSDMTGEYAEYDENFLKEKTTNWKNNNFMACESRLGSDACFILKGAKSLNEEAEFEVSSDSKADILRGFKKFQKGKSNSRQFLNRFIDEVA